MLVGLGSGREALVLAKKGFTVTGVDFSTDLTEMAKQNCRERGVRLEVLSQEASNLTPRACAYDIVWLAGGGVYSSIPGRGRRVRLLRKIRAALRDSGSLVCMFCSSGENKGSRFSRGDLIRRIAAWVTLGNLEWQAGDGLWADSIFYHTFPSESAVRAEFEEAGFRVVSMRLRQGCGCGALLRKNSAEGEI